MPVWNLLWAFAAIFILLWVLGVTFHFMIGGFIHALLVLAVVAVLFGIVERRRGRAA
jgi:hypothetical protein